MEQAAPEVGQVFKAEAESILPYAGRYSFEVADAHMRRADKVVAADQVNQRRNKWRYGKWREELKDIGGKASEGAANFFEKAKEGANKLKDKAQNCGSSINREIRV